ncbi:hypothetical protein [Mycobacteroides abscessus]|uniref:hypothetical protein n=1 Tax=Mycobacteroides abscessus TaxID=36809 RepID=UPI0013F5BE18|nr:hypothetical protein [Mycobacteroides abscessus]
MVVRVVDAADDVVVRVVDAATDVVLVVVVATVSAPGSAERILSGEAIATPMTPSATTSTAAKAICAPEDRLWGVAAGGYGPGPAMLGGATYPGVRPACAGGPG